MDLQYTQRGAGKGKNMNWGQVMGGRGIVRENIVGIVREGIVGICVREGIGDKC